MSTHNVKIQEKRSLGKAAPHEEMLRSTEEALQCGRSTLLAMDQQDGILISPYEQDITIKYTLYTY